MKDLHDVVRTKTILPPAALATGGATTGKVIDTQGYGGVEFIVAYGTRTASAGTVTLVMKEGTVSTASSLTSVADADMLGTEILASLTAGVAIASGTTKNVTKRVGYKGAKRYVTLGVASTTTQMASQILSITALLHSPNVAATDNP